MENPKSVTTPCEDDQHVVAAAQHILKALATSKTVSDDMRKTLLDLETQLSAMSIVNGRNGRGIKKLEKQLKCVEDIVTRWEENHSMIWDSGPSESSEYMKVVGEIQGLQQSLQNLSVSENWKQKQKELLWRANGILEGAMSRLEDELVHLLAQHKQHFEPEYMSFHSNRVDLECDELFGSVEDEQIEEVLRSSGGSQVSTVNLVNPAILGDLKSIANVMFASKYHQEFCQVFITSRRVALAEYFVILEMEKLSIENVLRLEWHGLNHEIKKWIRAVKIIVRVYLVNEKRLCKRILGDLGSVYQFCYYEISQSFMLHLLNFGEAVAMGTQTPERLFCLLNMYEVLDQLAVDVDILFFEDVGSFVRGEFHKLLSKFGDTVKSTFLSFINAIATNPSKSPLPGGGVHHLTKYVMNYIKTLTEYGDILNLLPDETSMNPASNNHDSTTLSNSSLASHFRSIVTALESNLTIKAKLYEDVALQHIFMMNNIHYMVQKVKSPELSHFFEDSWIRQHSGRYRRDAISYERVAWGSVLSMLKDDGVSNCVPLEKRFKRFNTAFGEVYRTQTGWIIPDPQLREDLQTSVSHKLVHAYRTYIGRHSSNIAQKHIKFTVDDLQRYILDLFQGLPKSLQRK